MRVLTYTLGASSDFVVQLTTEDGEPESIAGATAAVLTVKTAVGGSVILERSTDAGTMTIDAGTAELTCDAPHPDTEPGEYIADGMVMIAGQWYDLLPFAFRLRRGVTAMTQWDAGAITMTASLPAATVTTA